MRIEPIAPSIYAPITAIPPIDHSKEEKAEEQEASKEVTSLWYATTLQSLKEAVEPSDPKMTEKALSSVEGMKEEKSFVREMQDWLWSAYSWANDLISGAFNWVKEAIFGESKKSQEIEEHVGSANKSTPLHAVPKLDPPINSQKLQLKQAILDFNRDVAMRLKDIQEFEEEMRRSNSNKLDKLIFIHFVSTSLKQKEISESSSLISNEELLRNFNRNKALQKTYFSLVDEARSLTKTSSILHWVHVGGVTAGVIGTLAFSVATGGVGAFLMVALPLATLVNGGVKMLEGTMKYKAELKEGELFMISQERKENSSEIKDEMRVMQENDQDISYLLKAIRRQLEEQSQAERASFAH